MTTGLKQRPRGGRGPPAHAAPRRRAARRRSSVSDPTPAAPPPPRPAAAAAAGRAAARAAGAAAAGAAAAAADQGGGLPRRPCAAGLGGRGVLLQWRPFPQLLPRDRPSAPPPPSPVPLPSRPPSASRQASQRLRLPRILALSPLRRAPRSPARCSRPPPPSPPHPVPLPHPLRPCRSPCFTPAAPCALLLHLLLFPSPPTTDPPQRGRGKSSPATPSAGVVQGAPLETART